MEPDLDREEDLQPQPKELSGEQLLTTEYLGVCSHHPVHLTQYTVTPEKSVTQQVCTNYSESDQHLFSVSQSITRH